MSAFAAAAARVSSTLAFDEQPDGQCSKITGSSCSSRRSLTYVDGSPDRLHRRAHGGRLQGREPERRRGLWLRLVVPRRRARSPALPFRARRITSQRTAHAPFPGRVHAPDRTDCSGRASMSARGTCRPVVRCGRHGSRVVITSLGGGIARAHRRSDPRRMPRSPGARMSGRPSWNIRNMCALHAPSPLTATSSAITASSSSWSSRSSSSVPDHVLGERTQVADLRARGRRPRAAPRGRRRAPRCGVGGSPPK